MSPTNVLNRWGSMDVEPVSELTAALPDPHGYAWVHRAGGFVAWGTSARTEVARGANRFALASGWLDETFRGIRCDEGALPLAVGSFSFDPGASSELVVPAAVLRAGDGVARLDFSGDSPPGMIGSPVPARVPRIRYAGSTISELSWIEAVDSAVAEIAASHLKKVVLARDLLVWAREPFDRRLLAARLARRFPDCYTFMFGTLVGATPELLVRRSGSSVESLVLAGSARRGTSAEEDDAIGEGLLASAKDVREHELSVDSVTNVLADVCGELTIEGPFLMKLANVQHIATRVSGAASGAHTALEIAGLLHPTAAVCGAPRAAAMKAIRRLEGMDRGRYSGPVGWVDANGDGEFGIALRCAEVDGTRARLFAGNGIVADSRPEAELEETRLKLRAMQDALSSD